MIFLLPGHDIPPTLDDIPVPECEAMMIFLPGGDIPYPPFNISPTLDDIPLTSR